jgi:L-lactate dehydrogenase complex protein LldF
MSHSDLRQRIAAAAADRRVVDAVHVATWRKVDARAEAMSRLRHAEALRDRAAQIRRHTLENLPTYLEQFVDQATARGAVVTFAADADAACRRIVDIARQRDLRLAAKSKSMTTEEVHLNDALEAAGVRVVETDLGEFIVQLDHDRPSHIITPIIHKDRRQVAAAMARELGCAYSEDPEQLTRIARAYLRDIFRRCDLGITGANFAIAETGTLTLLTNEGNGRLTVTRPRVHVALVGIDKMLPRLRDLPVMLKLLARSSTGQPMGAYTTLITGPRRPDDVDGPDELHIILLDNGRSRILTGPTPDVLRCIRCGACLNACPAYRNVGGHAYNSVYPGPIGSLLSPLLYGPPLDELPRVSSLCGMCAEVCPVRIDIPALLVRLRAQAHRRQPLTKRLGLRAWSWLMQRPRLYALAQKALGEFLPDHGEGWVQRGVGPLGDWTAQRDLPRPPAQSFRAWWAENARRDSSAGGRDEP